MHVIYHHFSSEFVKTHLKKVIQTHLRGKLTCVFKNLFSKLPSILATTFKYSNFKAFESAEGEFRIVLYKIVSSFQP